MTDNPIAELDAIDPDEVIFGEDGSIESMTDPDSGEVIKADPKPEARSNPRGPADINPDQGTRPTTDTGDDDQDNNDNQPSQSPSRRTSEAADDFLTDTLAVYGLESDEIEWNGEQTRVRDLSSEDRREFLEELRDRDRAEAAGLNEAELELLDFVRSGGDLREAFGGQPAPQSSVAVLDADGLNRLDIRQQYPDLTEDEVSEELEHRKGSSLYDKKTGALRERLTTVEQVEQQAASEREFTAQRTQFTTAASALTEVLGFPVNDQIRQHLLARTASEEQNGQSPFLNSLTPERILRLEYLDTFAPQMQAHYEEQIKASYKRGREEALNGAPTRPSGRSGSAGGTARQAAPRDEKQYEDYTLGQS